MTGDNATINDLLVLQAELMVALGIDPQSGEISAGGKPSQTELGAAIGITVESAEILEAMDKAGRKWKEKGGSLCDDVQEELADVLFFVLELMVLLGLNGEQMAQLYLQKYKKNLIRLTNASVTRDGEIEMKIFKLLEKHFGREDADRLLKKAHRNHPNFREKEE